MSHSLGLYADGRLAGRLHYEPAQDRWTLIYEPAWVAWPNAFPLSPALPFESPSGYAPGAVKRFVENLLPEGRALDISATTYNLSKTNIFGLIHALGVETSGAFRFWPDDCPPPGSAALAPLREVSLTELNERLAQRAQIPFVLWDGKPRMSVAGYQDKLLVYLDAPLGAAGGGMFLTEPPMASTHILKPQPLDPSMPHLVVNEHYCMTLAFRMGLPVARTSLLRAQCPVLVVSRFDRMKTLGPDGPGGPNGPDGFVSRPVIQRLHVIDACQACDLPVSSKYERNIGNGEMVRHIRDGVSFERLFSRVEQTMNKAAARLNMLRWALFQLLIGNSDAHGKNYSFFVQGAGLEPAPWYDLVSVVQYPNVNHEMAMAYGDVFVHEEVKSFALADFAQRCGVDRAVLRREAARMARLVQKHAMALAQSDDYREDERAFVQQISRFVVAQAIRLEREVGLAARIRDEFL